MVSFTWLASYPKSGNTWLRILLANYLRDGSEPVDINKLGGGSIASARIWFDEWAGIEASALDDATIECLRPRVYRCIAHAEKEPVYMKVHDSWQLTAWGESMFPADVTNGVVYVLRNPLDLASSYANHLGATLEQAVECMCDPHHSLSRSMDGLSGQLRQHLGSWGGHVISWLDCSGLPVHLVRYEDMRRDPEATFGGVVRFCGLPDDEERIRKAVAFSDFSELQRQENAGGFRERSSRSSGMFFRRGRAGCWREDLPEDLVQRLIDTHGETMRRFGYLDEDNRPI